MITKDYLNDFNSPIRNITGKTELYKSSVSTLSGNYLSLGMVAPPGEKLTVKATSKNLLDLTSIYGKTLNTNGATMTCNSDGSISVSGTPTGYVCLYSNYYTLPIDTYTLSISGDSVNVAFSYTIMDEANNKLAEGNIVGGGSSRTINLADYPTYSKIYFEIKRAANKVEMSGTAYCQIEKGSTATPYTPYIDITKQGYIKEKAIQSIDFYTDSNMNEGFSKVVDIQEYYGRNDKLIFEDGTYWLGSGQTDNEINGTDNHELGEFFSVGDYAYFDGYWLYTATSASIDKSITVSGRNLLPKDTFYHYPDKRDNYYEFTNLPHGTYTLSGWITKYPDDTSTATRLKIVVYYTDNTTTLKFIGMDYECAESDGVPRYKSGSVATDTTKEIKKIEVSLDYSALNNPNRIAENVMLEFGSTATEYEPYQEPTVYTIGETTTVDVAPYHPTTSIYSNVNGILLETTYNALTLSNTFTHTDALKEISINRVGEKGRFFGFDITQKATINLLDKNRELEVSDNDFFKVFFNINDNEYVNNTPLFKATDTKRDENTNALTITAEDILMCAAGGITVAEMGLTAYSIRDIAEECARILGLGLVIRGFEDETCFDTYYETGANFDGTETIREVIKAIAEATQSIAYLTADSLVFRRLGAAAADLTIEKQHYFTLKNNGEKTLANVCHATSLGDNVISTSSTLGATQYVRDNPFWDMREDIATLVDKAAAAISGFTLSQFDCSWRGNFLLEIGDRIDINAKDGSMLTSYLLEDTISYKGGYNQTSTWAYEAQEETASNPSTLGEVIKQTFAKVDKANKQIELVASESSANKEAISALQINTGSISASVSSLEETVKGNQEATNEELSTLRNKVDLQITPEQVNIAIQEEMTKGVDKVITSTGYSLTSEGLNISKSDSDVSTIISHEGMEVAAAGQEMLVANHEGVNAVNLKAKNYLIIDGKSRFQTWNKRTACFWIGGK